MSRNPAVFFFSDMACELFNFLQGAKREISAGAGVSTMESLYLESSIS